MRINPISQTITIFLTSSAELKYDREKFEQFIGRKNKTLIEHDRFIKLVIWEDFIDAMFQTRLQDEYNKAIRESDIPLSNHFQSALSTSKNFPKRL